MLRCCNRYQAILSVEFGLHIECCIWRQIQAGHGSFCINSTCSQTIGLRVIYPDLIKGITDLNAHFGNDINTYIGGDVCTFIGPGGRTYSHMRGHIIDQEPIVIYPFQGNYFLMIDTVQQGHILSCIADILYACHFADGIFLNIRKCKKLAFFRRDSHFRIEGCVHPLYILFQSVINRKQHHHCRCSECNGSDTDPSNNIDRLGSLLSLKVS
ncbi:hypothetical protein D3C86_1061400 [compost metagenome]